MREAFAPHVSSALASAPISLHLALCPACWVQYVTTLFLWKGSDSKGSCTLIPRWVAFNHSHWSPAPSHDSCKHLVSFPGFLSLVQVAWENLLLSSWS